MLEIVRVAISHSSNIAALGFALNGKEVKVPGVDVPVALATLDIEFTSGALYRYEDVPATVCALLTSAEHPGKMFTSAVRKAGFSYTKLRDARKR